MKSIEKYEKSLFYKLFKDSFVDLDVIHKTLQERLDNESYLIRICLSQYGLSEYEKGYKDGLKERKARLKNKLNCNHKFIRVIK